MKKMNLNEIQELIKFVAKSGATEVDLELDGIKISIKSPPKKSRREKEEEKAMAQKSIISLESHPKEMIVQETIPAPQTPSATQNTSLEKEDPSEKNEEEKYITITSSMIGTFYRSPSPDKPPFVNIGDTIKEGDTICIIEAMKLFNEIESEISGKIVKVLVDDATPIEFGQDLFLIDPS